MLKLKVGDYILIAPDGLFCEYGVRAYYIHDMEINGVSPILEVEELEYFEVPNWDKIGTMEEQRYPILFKCHPFSNDKKIMLILDTLKNIYVIAENRNFKLYQGVII